MWVPKGACELMPPATGHSHDAIKALQATLLASHLAAKPQCLLHALPWREGQVAGSAYSSGQGWAPALRLLLRYSPWDRLKMTEALKVSPAPRVSTTWGGGKASECSSRPSGPRASAPSSAQAQTSIALQDPPLSWVSAHP